MHDDSQPARYRHGSLLLRAPLRKPQAPGFQVTGFASPAQQHLGRLEEMHPNEGVPALRYMAVIIHFPGGIFSWGQPQCRADSLRFLEPLRAVDKGLERESRQGSDAWNRHEELANIIIAHGVENQGDIRLTYHGASSSIADAAADSAGAGAPESEIEATYDMIKAAELELAVRCDPLTFVSALTASDLRAIYIAMRRVKLENHL